MSRNALRLGLLIVGAVALGLIFGILVDPNLMSNLKSSMFEQQVSDIKTYEAIFTLHTPLLEVLIP